MKGDAVGGLIDFYFSCTDLRAYDVAITHGAWCFSPDGSVFHPQVARALITGYGATHGLTDAEYAALPILGRGAALRFLLTRAYDWINTPPGALVTRKIRSPICGGSKLMRPAQSRQCSGRALERRDRD